jgi:hypothetical protein
MILFRSLLHVSYTGVKWQLVISFQQSALNQMIDDVPSFITKSCSEIFIPILSYILNSHLLKAKFPS